MPASVYGGIERGRERRMEESDHRPSKRLRIQSPNIGKGKEKMDEPAGDLDADSTCGICLSDGGMALRGRMDSCDHFFCFVCIMEWAKIESRCPTCKRRFQSIRRPPLPGLFPCERLVKVPHRNQVYNTHGNGSTTLSDPYDHVNCSACNSSANEELLLLCDLCDSAVHTYCAGLGHTVPEGDWYCSDCAISREEHTKTQSDDITSYSSQNLSSFSTIQVFEERRGDEESFRNTSQVAHQDFMLNIEHSPLPTITAGETRLSTSQPVGIAFSSSVSNGSSAKMTSDANVSSVKHNNIGSQDVSKAWKIMEIAKSSKPTVSVIEIVPEEERTDDRLPSRSTSRRASQASSSSPTVPVEKTVLSTRAEGVDKGPRTLSRCRSLHGRIRELRANWNALRAGSVAFSSSVSNGSSRAKMTSDANASGEKHSSIGSQDVSKAWKMMTNGSSHAKMTSDANASGEKHNSIGSQDVSKAWKMMEIAKSIKPTERGSISKRNASKGAGDLHSSSFIPKGNISAHRVAGSTESDVYRDSSRRILPNKCKSQNIEKQKSDTKTLEMHQICREPGSILQSGYSESASTKQDKFSLKDGSNGKEDPATQRNNILKRSTNSTDADSIGRSRTVDNNAKEEVQSLVKLNLKLLSRVRQLGTEQFKEVARVATHTILAACGLEHSKSSACCFSSSICRHNKQIQISKSSLMPNSCRECFYMFVKNVVDSVLSEKNPIPNSH